MVRSWRRHILGVLVLAILGWSCDAPTVRVTRGGIDLSGWDFAHQGAVRLDGEWELWPDKATAPVYQDLPGYWNASPRSPLPAEGKVTYRLNLTLPAGGGPWALAIPDVSCAWRLRVGSQVLAQNGRVSLDLREYREEVRPRVVGLPDGWTVFPLELEVVNLSDRVGGIRDSVKVGTLEELDRQQRLARFDSAFFVGGLLVMALFNIVVFFLQRQRGANLWLAVFSFFIAVRTLFTGARSVFDLWPTLGFTPMAQVEYLCVFGAVTSFIFYLRGLYPDWWPGRVFIPFLFYTGLFVLLLFVMPLKTYAQIFYQYYDLPLVLMVFVFVGVTWWAVRKKHEDGPLVFLGMLFLLCGTLNDLLYQFVPLPQGYVMGRFLFVFLVFNTYILSRQFSKDYLLTQRQSRELRQLDRMKDDFLARVTHELRTPINGMVGILDAFRMGDFGPLSERQHYHLGLLEASSKRLLSMVNSILDFSHLKKHSVVSEARPILLKETVDFLLPSFYPRMRPGVALVNRISDRLPAALGDEVKLEQVLHHLVENALQHTEAGTVALEAEVKDQRLVLLVKDTGKGIPADKLSQLFSPFHQADDLDSRTQGGLGLGLAISRQLVLQMGGSLDLQSQEGVGTTAVMSIPVCPPAKLQYFQAQRIDRPVHWEPSRYETSLPPAPVDPAPPEIVPVPGAPTVLIVDDEPVNLLVLRNILSKTGYTVLEASNGFEALEKVTQNVVDLMVLDIMMPGMSGYEVCTKVRERFTAARLPILLLTAKNQVEDLMQGFQCGASDFLTKPPQREELKARMVLHLKVSQAARSGTVVENHP